MTPAGQPVELFTLTNTRRTQVRFMSYGGVILSVTLPDRRGILENVTLGYGSLEEYLAGVPSVGALIGRFANRIANGRFSLDGRVYTLTRNDGPHHLHGGATGFADVVWSVEPFHDARGVGAMLTHLSLANEEGYPGTLAAWVTFTLTDTDELCFDYHATSDAATPVNFTQHSYFNLAGNGRGDILDHELLIPASRFTPVDATLIPTGEIRPVAGTPFDFTRPVTIGARIADDDEQLRLAGGYDHNFVLDSPDAARISLGARLHHPPSGRTLEIHTTEPGLQLYSGNKLDVTHRRPDGRVLRRRAGVALETQHFPDSPNQPGFPATILRPGETFHSRTLFRFSVEGRIGR